MKIESIIKRQGGTLVEMDAPKRAYKFVPEDGQHESPHVAEVDVESHAKSLLRITEGFRLAEGEDEPEFTNRRSGGDNQLVGSNVHNASYQLSGGGEITLPDLIQMAFDDSGLSEEQWNDLPDQERYEYIDATLSELHDGGLPDGHKNEQEPPAPPVQPQTDSTILPPVEPEDRDDDNNTDEGNAGQQQNPPQVEPTAPPVTPPAEEKPPVAAAADEEKPLEERPRKELVELYQKRFGRQPSTRMSIGDIAHALSEED